MPEKRGRPATELGRAQASRVRALALLRWIQVREKRREWNRIVDAGMAAALALTRDRLLAIPDRISTLTSEERQTLRNELTDALEAWSHAELPSERF
jgi:hypothetical protein